MQFSRLWANLDRSISVYQCVGYQDSEHFWVFIEIAHQNGFHITEPVNNNPHQRIRNI